VAEAVVAPTTLAEAPEREIAVDLARRGLMVGPVFLAVGAIFWQMGGLASSALALGLVILNFLAGAWLLGWAAKISPNLLMGAALGGYILRLGLITAVVLPIRDASWFEIAPFAITLIVSHLGLLVWETKYVSASLAYPGLKPAGDSLIGSAKVEE